MGKIKKISKIIYGFVIAILVVIVVAVLVSYTNISNGFKLYTVQSGSMEPVIHVGSVIVSKPQKEYLKGDIITFYLAGSNSKDTATHRIYDIKTNNEKSVYITKGDTNNSPDADAIEQSSIIGKLVLSIPLIGYPVAYARTQTGLIVLIIIPSTLIIYSELLNIKKEIVRIIKVKNEKKTT